MPSHAEKLLESLKSNRKNRKRIELVQLFEGFGFIIEGGGKHDKVSHPDYPQILPTSLPTDKRVHEYLVKQAIKMVTQLQELQKKDK